MTRLLTAYDEGPQWVKFLITADPGLNAVNAIIGEMTSVNVTVN